MEILQNSNRQTHFWIYTNIDGLVIVILIHSYKKPPFLGLLIHECKPVCTRGYSQLFWMEMSLTVQTQRNLQLGPCGWKICVKLKNREAPLIWSQSWNISYEDRLRIGVVQPGERRVGMTSEHFSIAKGGLQESCRETLHMGMQWVWR